MNCAIPMGDLITSNDSWQEHQAEVNATGLTPTDPRECAIVTWLFPANYTAIVRGKNGATGVALVEAYHLDAGQSSPRCGVRAALPNCAAGRRSCRA